MTRAGELNHWSAEPIANIDHRKYQLMIDWKPHGFWFDVNRDWLRWCKSEGFREESLAHRHRIRLADNAAILRLVGTDAIRRFTEEYTVPHPALIHIGDEASILGRYHRAVIDWPRIAESFQGIIITPYCWQARMDFMWYYGWDCASGCVWDPSILTIDAVFHKGRRMR